MKRYYPGGKSKEVKKAEKRGRQNLKNMEVIMNFNKCTTVQVTAALGISLNTLYEWLLKGFPRNADKSFNLPQIFSWYAHRLTEKYTTTGLKRKKIETEIEMKQTQIKKLRGDLVERSLMKTILASRAGNLRRFLEKTFVNNAINLVGHDVNKMRTLLFELVQQAMAAYIGSSK